MQTLNVHSQVLTKKYITKHLNGKMYHSLIGEGHNILLNDTEESFYDHVIIEFKDDKIVTRRNRTKNESFERIMNVKPIIHNYVLKDSIITLSDIQDWDIKISVKPIKLFVLLRVYNIQFPLTAVTKSK